MNKKLHLDRINTLSEIAKTRGTMTVCPWFGLTYWKCKDCVKHFSQFAKKRSIRRRYSICPTVVFSYDPKRLIKLIDDYVTHEIMKGK